MDCASTPDICGTGDEVKDAPFKVQTIGGLVACRCWSMAALLRSIWCAQIGRKEIPLNVDQDSLLDFPSKSKIGYCALTRSPWEIHIVVVLTETARVEDAMDWVQFLRLCQ